MLASQGQDAEKNDAHIQLVNQEKELRDLIKQDIDRTMQDIEFFTREDVKENLSNILYLWAKDNNEFSYRQGMNEILALIVQVSFEEIIETTFDLSEPIEGPKQMEQYSQDQIIEYLFSANHIYADIYWMFEKTMNFGVKYLYQLTKDMS